MKRLLLSIILLITSIYMNAQVRMELNIPPRIQWPNANGYCGENSIQMCGLYYGEYISEKVVRDVAGGTELLIYVNDTTTVTTFSMNYAEWDPNLPTPQYKNYLDWVKQYLDKKQPVIITVYVSGLSDPDYDHIVPAIGFDATNVNTYTSTDSLTYNDNFATTPFTRIFSTLYGTRSVANNSAPFPYYVPQNVDYGLAITGNIDPGKVLRPVHIALDSNDEPNVTLGAKPCMLKATITMDSLTVGTNYALLRYNNYLTVPSTGFSPTNANSAVYFKATATTNTVVDSFMSDTAVFYRCIAYTPTGIDEAQAANGHFLLFPNPADKVLNVTFTGSKESTVSVNIIDMTGRTIMETDDVKTSNNNMTINISGLPSGVYFVKMSAGSSTQVEKFIKE